MLVLFTKCDALLVCSSGSAPFCVRIRYRHLGQEGRAIKVFQDKSCQDKVILLNKSQSKEDTFSIVQGPEIG